MEATLLIKGVIEILSSVLKLGGLKRSEDRIAIAPTSVAYTMPSPA